MSGSYPVLKAPRLGNECQEAAVSGPGVSLELGLESGKAKHGHLARTYTVISGTLWPKICHVKTDMMYLWLLLKSSKHCGYWSTGIKFDKTSWRNVEKVSRGVNSSLSSVRLRGRLLTFHSQQLYFNPTIWSTWIAVYVAMLLQSACCLMIEGTFKSSNVHTRRTYWRRLRPKQSER